MKYWQHTYKNSKYFLFFIPIVVGFTVYWAVNQQDAGRDILFTYIGMLVLIAVLLAGNYVAWVQDSRI